MGMPAEGPGRVVAGGSVADDVEVELAVGGSVPSLAVGLRPEMSILGSLDVPWSAYTAWGASLHFKHAGRK